MTLSSTESRVSYAGDGATSAFAFPYPFFGKADLDVILVAAGGGETTQLLDSDYTVAGAGDPAGGTVTMTAAPVAGDTLVIRRLLNFVQPDDYQSNGPLPAETLEQGFDRLVMLAQQLNEALNRVFKLSPGSSGSATLPNPSEGAVLGWASGALANLSIAATAETFIFGNGLDKTGSTVSADLAAVDPALEFDSGKLRVKTDGVTTQRTSSGLKPLLTPVQKTASYGVTTSDLGKVIYAEPAASLTLSLPPVATAGNGFYVWAQMRAGTGTVTLDPDGSELIDGQASIQLTWQDLGTTDPDGIVGGWALVVCDGTAWRTIRAPVPAVKATMEAAASNFRYVTPAVMQDHPGVAKAWAACTVSGAAVTVAEGHNVPSVDYNGVGDYTVNLGITMASATYPYWITADDDVSLTHVRDIDRTATTIRFRVRDNGSSALDPDRFNIEIKGTLA